ncbi:MAG: hypothetical protein MR598_06410 [Erysipelotrichaceae bacterium]|nr:hypothetical protein [Erysipelotrichaceae bacterium]
MRKKFLTLTFLLIIILTGCELSNNPTSKVEEQLSKYQMLDKDITISYTDLSNDVDMDNETKQRYEKLIKKQYQNLSYEIKEETIDGDTAVVVVQIEVVDYQKIIEKYDQTTYSKEEYHDKVLTDLEKATEKVTYTINFTTNKDEKGNWQVVPLTTIERQKLLGMNKQNEEAYT